MNIEDIQAVNSILSMILQIFAIIVLIALVGLILKVNSYINNLKNEVNHFKQQVELETQSIKAKVENTFSLDSIGKVVSISMHYFLNTYLLSTTLSQLGKVSKKVLKNI